MKETEPPHQLVIFKKANWEQSGFKILMFQKRGNYYYLINLKIVAVQSQGNEGNCYKKCIENKALCSQQSYSGSASPVVIE